MEAKAINATSRIRIVDFVRCVSILTVVVGHYFSITFDSNPDQSSSIQGMLYRFLCGFGSRNLYGVSLFFVISGFVITRMTAQRENNLFTMNMRNFYTRRMARIIPLLSLVVGLGLLIVSTCPAGSNAYIPQSASIIFSPDHKNFDAMFFFRSLRSA